EPLLRKEARDQEEAVARIPGNLSVKDDLESHVKGKGLGQGIEERPKIAQKIVLVPNLDFLFCQLENHIEVIPEISPGRLEAFSFMPRGPERLCAPSLDPRRGTLPFDHFIGLAHAALGLSSATSTAPHSLHTLREWRQCLPCGPGSDVSGS